MSNLVVVGAQWGDEGKAKVIDYLCKHCDMVVRFQGGANAGHTVIANGHKFIFHLVPSGIMYPDKICVVGNGVVFDAEQFLVEVDDLKSRNLSVEGRLFVSDLAHLVLPYHKALDLAVEASKGVNKIGTTGRGIGPAYSDKVGRTGIRVGDLRDWDTFVRKLTQNYNDKRDIIRNLYHGEIPETLEAIIERYQIVRSRILPMVTDTARMLFEAARAGKGILYEGAQGSFLDIDHGTYPFVTSSNCIAGSVCTGAGVGPSTIDHVIGIVKAYTTRVGNGPFPTELLDPTGEAMRKEGAEFGSTTGRPRRCGWFDSVLIRKAVQLNGMTRIALTKLDVLSIFDEVKICTHYMVDGQKTEDFPTDPVVLARAVPVYETLKGWKQDIGSCTALNDLPANARTYISRLQELCYKVPFLIISVGPDRVQTFEVDPV